MTSMYKVVVSTIGYNPNNECPENLWVNVSDPKRIVSNKALGRLNAQVIKLNNEVERLQSTNGYYVPRRDYFFYVEKDVEHIGRIQIRYEDNGGYTYEPEYELVITANSARQARRWALKWTLFKVHKWEIED